MISFRKLIREILDIGDEGDLDFFYEEATNRLKSALSFVRKEQSGVTRQQKNQLQLLLSSLEIAVRELSTKKEERNSSSDTDLSSLDDEFEFDKEEELKNQQKLFRRLTF